MKPILTFLSNSSLTIGRKHFASEQCPRLTPGLTPTRGTWEGQSCLISCSSFLSDVCVMYNGFFYHLGTAFGPSHKNVMAIYILILHWYLSQRQKHCLSCTSETFGHAPAILIPVCNNFLYTLAHDFSGSMQNHRKRRRDQMAERRAGPVWCACRIRGWACAALLPDSCHLDALVRPTTSVTPRILLGGVRLDSDPTVSVSSLLSLPHSSRLVSRFDSLKFSLNRFNCGKSHSLRHLNVPVTPCDA